MASLSGADAVQQDNGPGCNAHDEKDIEPLYHGKWKQIPELGIAVLQSLGRPGHRVCRLRTADTVPVSAEDGQNACRPNMYQLVLFDEFYHMFLLYCTKIAVHSITPC